MLEIQYDLFKPREGCRVDAIESKLNKIEQSYEKVRKGQFAKIGSQNKRIDDIESRLAILEKYICEI